MKSRWSLSRKIILLVTALLLFSSALFCVISIYRSQVGIRKAIRQRMVDIANCAAGSVNGDILESLTAADIDTPEYKTVFDSIAVFRDNVELDYIYAIKDEGDGRFTFTVDTDLTDPGAFGDEVKYTEALNTAARGTTAVDEVPYSDRWGDFYSAYSPVFDSAGKVAGVVAADFSVAWFDAQLQSQSADTVRAYVVILLVTLLAAAVLCFLTVRPFVRMQEQLLEEKVTAESANRAKSDFLANMSHEIRTPINAMLGMNELVLRESNQGKELPAGDTEGVLKAFDQIGSYARDAERAGQSLLSIINDILDFSRIESGRMELAETRYPLHTLLEDVGNMIRLKAQEKGLSFSLDADPALPGCLIGDEVRIREVLTNLLNNAVKYTEHGYVRLTARVGEREGDTVRLVFTVEDSGIGIRRKDMEKLFTKFQRLDMERNSTVEGSGLGLVITQSLLDMMNGTVEVDSEYGKGSVFTVTVPQKIAAEDENSDAAQSELEKSILAPEARLLIVDDTKMNLIVTASLLKHTEARVDTALSGAESLELAEKNSYDIIFIDQRMPEMDGTEALRRIRQLKNKNSRIPVICLTADAIVGAKERYLAEGFTDYLTKPVNSRQLEAMLMKYLPKKKFTVVTTEKAEPAAKAPAQPEGGDAWAALRAAEIRPETGLMYCQEDETLYRSLLQEFAGNAKEKSDGMQAAFAAEDWKTYGLLVHSLKSTSGTIGAEKLSGIAAGLEKAANENNAAKIRQDHESALELYRRAAEAAEKTAGKTGKQVSPEEVVLEFLPEE